MKPSPRRKIYAYLQLTRPANILTAVADILAGFAVSGATIEIFNKGNGWFYMPECNNLFLLMVSSAGLYGGGVVLNDFFDADLDKTERPERPLPSGRASKTGAFILGVVLLSAGIQAASFVSSHSSVIAISVACLAVVYDAWGKRHALLGPMNMGLCRGGNLLLGISAVPASLDDFWFIAFIPLIYIAAVTLVSRGEVHGVEKKSLRMAGWLYGLVLILIGFLAFIPFYYLRFSLVFMVMFAYFIFRPLRTAQRSGKPKDAGNAVKAGVLGLILMDAAIAAGFAGWDYSLLIVLLLPLSMAMARAFAVT